MKKKYTWGEVCGKDKWKIIVLLCLIAICIGLVAYSASMIAAKLVNFIVYEKKQNLYDTIVFLIIFLVNFFLISYLRKLSIKILVGIREKIEEKIFVELLNKSILEYDYNGKTMSAITEDKNKIIAFIENSLSDLIESIVISFLMGAIVLYIDKILFLCVLLCSIISASSYFCAKRIESCEKERLVKMDQEYKSFLEIFRMTEVLKFHKSSNRLLLDNRKNVEQYAEKEYEKKSINLKFEMISYLCNLLRELLVIFYGAIYADMNIGMVIAMLNMTSFFGEIVKELGNYHLKSTECSVSIKHLMELLENVEATSEHFVKKEKVNCIIISNLSFKYDEKSGFEKFSASFEKNKINLLIGENGVGKSTLIKILCGLLSPQSGEIFFDSDRQEKMDLRKNTSYVDQSNTLLKGTILENITGFDEKPNEELVVELVKKLNLDEWLSHIEDGIYHVLNNENIDMSGGQRQRIAIARALYKKSPVIIMDEPTASLDNDNKKKFWELLKIIKKERILIIVSHDYDFMKYAEYVCELKKGY